MFVRRKANPSGSFSVQLVSKERGGYRVVRSFDTGTTEAELLELEREAQEDLAKRKGQLSLDLGYSEDTAFMGQLPSSLEGIEPAGPEMILGRLFDEIGFDQIPDPLLRHLVLCRLVSPGSKLATVDYLRQYHGIDYTVASVYRHLDRIHDTYQQQLEDISYRHSLEVHGGVMQMVFYDVTTLYFEAESEDDLRKAGFSKDGKHQHPQIVLGLLVSADGYPLAFQMFEGNKFEGHTLIPVLQAFSTRFGLEKVTVVADAGLLSTDNLNHLRSCGHTFIVGARIKKEKPELRERILSMKLADGKAGELERDDGSRLIIGYSEARARKDRSNREKGIRKLEASIRSGKVGKASLTNRGYSRFLRLTGEAHVEIDQESVRSDERWDGLKGYVTNSNLGIEEVTKAYKSLWVIERAFRISKTDLRVRPIYHRRGHRIMAHLTVAFCAYKVFKELERRLSMAGSDMSAEKAIDCLKTIYRVKIRLPMSKSRTEILWYRTSDQKSLLKIFGY